MCGNIYGTAVLILAGRRETTHLKLVICTDAEQFLNRCESWLRQRSDIHNAMYYSAILISRQSPVFTGPYWYGVVEDDSGDIVACGCHNRPNGLFISETPESMLDEVHSSVANAVGVPHRIMAPQLTAKYLAERSSDTNGVSIRFQARWHTYRLDDIDWPGDDIRGRLRKGRSDEADLIAQWGRAFGEEQPAPVDVSEFMLRKLSVGDLYVWDDSGAKTVLSLSGPAGKGIRISGVYTPPEFRGNGYASAAIAALSHAQLSNGMDFVVLAVTAGNPAEELYQKLGFRLVGSSDCFSMDE